MKRHLQGFVFGIVVIEFNIYKRIERMRAILGEVLGLSHDLLLPCEVDVVHLVIEPLQHLRIWLKKILL